MPNWCENTLTVTGDIESLRKFVDTIQTTDSEGNPTIKLFNTIIPCPQELQDTFSGWSSDESEQAEHEKKYAENVAKYGYRDWYDWNIANWGTKWDACDGYIHDELPLSDNETEVMLSFNTAWSSPIVGMVKVSQAFPTLTFAMSSVEEQVLEAEFFIAKNGVFVHEAADTNFDYEYTDDLDWDDYYEKRENARINAQDAAESRARELFEDLMGSVNV